MPVADRLLKITLKGMGLHTRPSVALVDSLRGVENIEPNKVRMFHTSGFGLVKGTDLENPKLHECEEPFDILGVLLAAVEGGEIVYLYYEDDSNINVLEEIKKNLHSERFTKEHIVEIIDRSEVVGTFPEGV